MIEMTADLRAAEGAVNSCDGGGSSCIILYFLSHLSAMFLLWP